MRLLAPFVAMLVVAPVGPALSAELATGAELGPLTVFLERAEVLPAQRMCRMTLPAGETTLTMPLGALGVDPAQARLEVVEPESGVRVATMEIAAEAPQTARWRLIAEEACPVKLRLTYPLKGLSWGIEYAVTLAEGGWSRMDAQLRLSNGLTRALQEAAFVLPTGEHLVASLEAGESISLEVMELLAAVEAVEHSFIYDKEKIGDAAVEMLTIGHEELRRPFEHTGTGMGYALDRFQGPLPAGKVRLFASAEAGGELIAQTSIPYIPPGEPIELKVGPASGIAVSRTRTEAKEVNKRLDVHNKTVLFDLDEIYELEVRNLRRSPVELIVREHPQDTWQLLSANMLRVKVDAHTFEFRVQLEPGEERQFTYLVRRLNLKP